MRPCFQKSIFLLPNSTIDMQAWSVIACDQYTSQQDYWQNVQEIIQDKPSTYQMIYPEVYLQEKGDRISKIQKAMENYVHNNILEEKVKDGFILIERSTFSGNRMGLLGVIDLEAYDFEPGNVKPIRATEKTIASRIPPRVKIRKGAPLELSHVLVLLDDPKDELFSGLMKDKDTYPVLYDFDLMMNGGHIKGYAIEKENADQLESKIAQMQQERDLFLSVGDGNHSLATAKACWEEIKKGLNTQGQENHPARYAMVEMVNLHSPALIFEPIHRVLFHANMEELYEGLEVFCQQEEVQIRPGKEIVLYQDHREIGIELIKQNDRLPIDILQSFLDAYRLEHPKVDIDYIHGQDAMYSLLQTKENCGIFLQHIEKSALFPAIVAGGVLPRKTFSMGEADEKRFYLEARWIKEKEAD